MSHSTGSSSPDGDSEGPIFNFLAAEVVDAAKQVTALAMDLRDASLRLPSLPLENASETDYQAFMAVLIRSMPGLYAAYDRYLAAVLATGQGPVACAPSCPSCCSHYVTSVEAVELFFLDVVLKGRAEYADKLVAMHERTTVYSRVYKAKEGDEAEDKALHRYFMRGLACPFLTASGDCGVREARPTSCRMFFSYSHPRWCRGRGITSPANRNFHVGLPDEAEAYLAEASAALAGQRLSEHLFDGLLQVNEGFGRYSQPFIS